MLTQLEKNLIPIIEYRPELGADKLARMLRAKSTTISASIRRLREKSVIRLKAYVNPFALGYTPIALYATLLTEALASKSKIITQLIKSPYVTQVSELVGDYNHFCVFYVKNLFDVPDTMKMLYGGNGDIFSDKLLSPRINAWRFPKSYLSLSTMNRAQIKIHSTVAISKLDEIDHLILQFSANQGFDSVRKLADSINIPHTTVERRLKKLEDTGVISGFYYAINPDIIRSSHHRILIHTKALCKSTHDNLLKFCEEINNITFFIRSLGAWDYEIGVDVFEIKEMRSIVQELHKVCNIRIGTLRVLTEIENFKTTTYPLAYRN